MPKICYETVDFKPHKLRLIDQANAIVEEYREQGLVLTLRMLYYQFVARDLLPNTERSYKNLGKAVSDARIAGLIDWETIEDRTRELTDVNQWVSPKGELRYLASQYEVDRWAYHDTRVEVWVEKEALAAVVERPCRRLGVDFFCCKGYVSTSEMWTAAQRLIEYGEEQGQDVVILYLGDHDPSGFHMGENIVKRLRLFRTDFHLSRIALNMDQVRALNPPPNPAKVKDPRYEAYRKQFGEQSWELDALPPGYLDTLIETHVEAYVDDDATERALAKQAEIRQRFAELEREY